VAELVTCVALGVCTVAGEPILYVGATTPLSAQKHAAIILARVSAHQGESLSCPESRGETGE
jgi:hypothetical protein